MTYETDNIAVAAALRLYGHTIQEIEITGRRARFIFKEDAHADATDVNLGRKQVDAISFHEQIRRLSGLAKSMSAQVNTTTGRISE